MSNRSKSVIGIEVGRAVVESMSIQIASSASHQSRRLRCSSIRKTWLTGSTEYLLLLALGVAGEIHRLEHPVRLVDIEKEIMLRQQLA